MIFTTLSALLTVLALTSANPDLVKRADAFLIKAKGNPSLCLGTTGDLYNGILLSNIDCSEADVPNTRFKGQFEIQRGNNPSGIRLSGTDYCLDGILPLSDQGQISLYQCLPGVAQQTWYYTDDDHIALTGQNSCLDFAGQGCGRFNCAPGRAPCGAGLLGNPQGQQWVLGSVSVPQPPPTTPPPTTQGGRQLHPDGDWGRCVFEGNLKSAVAGVEPFVENCQSGGPNFNLQYFSLARGRGAIKLAGSYDLCLDYGSNPQNGDVARLQTCNGETSQDFYYTDEGDDHIAITGGSLCLDLRREDGRTLQFWQCGTNPQQKFTL